MATDAVVVHYHTPTLTDRFVASAKNQVRNLIIVINEFDDRDVRWAETWSRIPNVEVLTNKQNEGYAKAANEGATLLNQKPGDILAIFNSDVTVPKNGISHIQNYMASHPEIGIAGPKQTDQQNRIVHAGIFGTNRKPRHRGWHEKDKGQYAETRDDAITVSGSAYFVKQECWEQLSNDPEYLAAAKKVFGQTPLGAFAETHFYYEETWCSYFARHRGWKIAYLGKAPTFTHEWRGSEKDTATLTKYANRSRTQFRALCDHMGIDHD